MAHIEGHHDTSVGEALELEHVPTLAESANGDVVKILDKIQQLEDHSVETRQEAHNLTHIDIPLFGTVETASVITSGLFIVGGVLVVIITLILRSAAKRRKGEREERAARAKSEMEAQKERAKEYEETRKLFLGALERSHASHIHSLRSMVGIGGKRVPVEKL